MNRQLPGILVLCYKTGFVICYACIYWGGPYHTVISYCVTGSYVVLKITVLASRRLQHQNESLGFGAES